MALELLNSKMASVYFGNSTAVWSTVLFATLLGLAGGYYFGDKFSNKSKSSRNLFVALLISFILFALLPFSIEIVYGSLLNISLFWGSLIAFIITLSPIAFLFGTVSPLIIHLLVQDNPRPGYFSGLIYFISTLGGILSSLIIGFYLIPSIGIDNTLYVFVCFHLLALILGFYVYKYDSKK